MSWGQPQPTQPPQMTTEQRNQIIKDWLASKTTLDNAKSREMELREQVTKLLFPTPKKGTQRFDLGEGYKIKLVHKENPKLGDAEKLNASGDKIPVNDQIEATLIEIEKVGNEGVFLADRLIKTKYELSMSEYQKLDESNPSHKKIKAEIDKILTLTPAAPSLEFEEPKAS